MEMFSDKNDKKGARITCRTSSVAETQELGKQIGEFLHSREEGLCIALVGDLGMGKTHLAQGIARGFGITGEVASPTFALMNTYETIDGPLYHFDLYRLDDSYELENIGFSEFSEGTKCIVEWANKFEEEMPEDIIWVYLERVNTSENARELTLISPFLLEEDLLTIGGRYVFSN